MCYQDQRIAYHNRACRPTPWFKCSICHLQKELRRTVGPDFQPFSVQLSQVYALLSLLVHLPQIVWTDLTNEYVFSVRSNRDIMRLLESL